MAQRSPIDTLVGRASETEAIDASLALLEAGRGGVLLLVGEAGIGKSTLARYAAECAKDNGTAVYWGFSWESGGAPAYWPWTQLLRSLIGDIELSDAEKASLALLLPEFSSGSAKDEDLQPDQVRFQLLESVRMVLSRACAQHSMVLVLEDLHGADKASLNLLRHMVRHVTSMPLLIIGTYREYEARYSESADPLWQTLRDATVLRLGRLTPENVGDYLALRRGRTPEKSEVHEWFETTAGNPLFLSELAGLLDRPKPGDTASGRLPVSVEQVITQQVACLPPATSGLLYQASILGKTFSADELASTADKKPRDIEHALDPAVEAGIIHQTSPGGFEFSHGLYREVLYAGLDRDDRSALHLRYAQGLRESVARGDADGWSELASHLAAAGVEHRHEAVEAWHHAAERASDRLAFDEAAALLSTAVEAFGEGPRADPAKRCGLLLDCAKAMLQAGDIDGGRARCIEAFGIARTLEDAGLMSTAALTYGDAIVVASVDQTLIDMLRDSLDALPERDAPSRARVQARLSAALQPAADPGEPMEMAREAIGRARASGDEDTLYVVLRHAISALMDFAPPAERQALNREVLSMATGRGDVPVQFRSNLRLMIDAAELADRKAFDGALDACERIANRISLPHYQWRTASARAMQATFEGQFSRAMTCLEQAQALAERIGDVESGITIPIQRFAVLCEWDSDEAPSLAGIQEDLDRAFATGMGEAKFFVQPLVSAFTVSDAETARRILETPGLVSRTFTGCDRLSIVTIARLARVADDRDLALRTFGVLREYEKLCAVAGLLGSTWSGPVAYELGLLALYLRKFDDAKAHLDIALQLAERMNSRPFVARTHAALAALAERTGDTTGEKRHLDTASELFAALQMRPRRGLPSESGLAAQESPTTTGSDFSIKPQGEFSEVSLNGQSALVRNTKGVAMLEKLVSRPETDIHVLELGGRTAPASADGGDVGPALDQQARAAYRRRVEDLRDQLEEAERLDDIARAEELRAELDFIARELSRAYGLGGRARPQGKAAERARVNVRRRIKDAIARIEEQLPGAGRYLENTVKTGSYCRYSPM